MAGSHRPPAHTLLLLLPLNSRWYRASLSTPGYRCPAGTKSAECSCCWFLVAAPFTVTSVHLIWNTEKQGRKH